jgi:hypothetical protein
MNCALVSDSAGLSDASADDELCSTNLIGARKPCGLPKRKPTRIDNGGCEPVRRGFAPGKPLESPHERGHEKATTAFPAKACPGRDPGVSSSPQDTRQPN